MRALLLQALIVSWSWIRPVDYHDARRGGGEHASRAATRTHGARGGSERYAQALLGNLAGLGIVGESGLPRRAGAPGSPENPWTYARGTVRLSPAMARTQGSVGTRPRAAGDRHVDRPTGVRPWRQGHSATRRFLVQPATSRARDKNKGASQGEQPCVHAWAWQRHGDHSAGTADAMPLPYVRACVLTLPLHTPTGAWPSPSVTTTTHHSAAHGKLLYYVRSPKASAS